MKKNRIKIILSWALAACLIIACEDKWDDHYSKTPLNSTEVVIYEGSSADYLRNTSEISAMTEIMKQYKVLDTLAAKQQTFTILTYTNETLAGARIEDSVYFAKTSISDIALSPSRLTDGLSILMWNKKYLPVKTVVPNKAEGSGITIGGSEITKCIKTNDGYIYLMDSPIYSPKSLYQYLCDLGDEYSLFRDQVLGYEEKIFDPSHSTPIGIDETGNTIYDSVFMVKNSFLDRYKDRKHEGKIWDIYSEFYNSTLLIPSNAIWSQARSDAYDNFRRYMQSEPNTGDSTRIEEWLVGSCFYDTRLTPEQLTGTEDLFGVGGFTQDQTIATASPQWRPSVQKVDVSTPVELSNGIAYRIQQMRVPKNVIIWRFKSRFYQIWERADEEILEHFNFFNLDSLHQTHKAGEGFGGWSKETPEIEYIGLRAQATLAQIEYAKNSPTPVKAGLECTAYMLNGQNEVIVANVPGGEYTFYMGFLKNSFVWRLEIYFNDELIKSNVDPNTYNLDRGSGKGPYGYSYIDYYNEGGGNGVSQNYDTDGGEMGTVMIGNGNDDTNLYTFKIKMLDSTGELAKGSKFFFVYHWCLRPTADNY